MIWDSLKESERDKRRNVTTRVGRAATEVGRAGKIVKDDQNGDTVNALDKQDLDLPVEQATPGFRQLLGHLTRRLARSC